MRDDSLLEINQKYATLHMFKRDEVKQIFYITVSDYIYCNLEFTIVVCFGEHSCQIFLEFLHNFITLSVFLERIGTFF